MKLEETFTRATNQNPICPDITTQWQLGQVHQKDTVIIQEKIGDRCYQFSLIEGYALQHFIGKFTVGQVQNLCQQRFGNLDSNLVLQLLKKLLILGIVENSKFTVSPKLKSSVQWTCNPEGYWILDNSEDPTSSPMQVGDVDKVVIDDLGKSHQEICAKHSIHPQQLQQLLSMLAATGMLEGTQAFIPSRHKFNPL